MTLGLKSTETTVPPQASGGLSHVRRDKGPSEAQGCLRSHGNWQLGLETQASRLHKWGDIIVTKASIFWALPECPSHHFRTPFQEVCYFPHHTASSEGLKMPPWSTAWAWNSDHLAPGTPASWPPTPRELHSEGQHPPQHLDHCESQARTGGGEHG